MKTWSALGDMSPTSYVGKLIALLSVTIGLINITFIINTIGDCFEEVFRQYLDEHTRQIEEDRSEYIRRNVEEAQKKVEYLNHKRKRSTSIEIPRRRRR